MARDTRQIVNTFHVEQVGGYTIGDLATLGAAVKTWFDTYYKLMLPLNYSLNNLTLMALTLSVGFVVDDAIVMLENIVRHMEMGKTRM